MPSPEFDKLLAQIRALPLPESPTVDMMRMGFELMLSRVRFPEDVARETITAGGRPAERLTPPGADPGRILLYLHGGAYVIGSIATHRELAARIGRAAGAQVVIPDYRLAPEHPFPAAIEDAVAVYRWILDQGFSPGRIAIAGDSAGGGLTVATLLSLRDAGVPLPGAAALLSPWVDLVGEGASMKANAPHDPTVQYEPMRAMARRYLGDVDPRTPLASPIHADLRGLPPMLVHVGTAEALLDDASRLAARAREGGVDVTLEPWTAMIHVWHIYPKLPEAQEATARIGAFLRDKTSAG